MIFGQVFDFVASQIGRRLEEDLKNRIGSIADFDQPLVKPPLNAIIYDCEIIRCIPPVNPEATFDLDYCKGWGDFQGMGISVIGCYDYPADRYRIFMGDNIREFERLVFERQHLIGFNSTAFDDNLCAAHGLEILTTYDLLSEVRVASGQPPHYVKGETRAGYSLEQMAQTNLGYGKSGNGELAPALWQQGKLGAVVDYCLGDVAITKKLFDKRSSLIDPTNGETLVLREP